MSGDCIVDCSRRIEALKLRRRKYCLSSVDVLVVLHAVVPVPLCPIQLLHRIKTVPISIISIRDVAIRFDMWLLLLLRLFMIIIVRFVPMWMLIGFLSFCLITALSPLITPVTVLMIEVLVLICSDLIESPIIVSLILAI